MNIFAKKQTRRFWYAFRGYSRGYSTDLNIRIHVWSLVFYALLGWYAWPLREIEILFLTLAYVLIFITELQNTSFERALNKLHPELHADIGDSKDMAASAVLTAALFAGVVCVSILLSRLT
jgi:diacylglycerol kinase